MSSWMAVQAMEVKIGAADLGPVGVMDDAGGFGTDSAISRGRGGQEGRALEKWTTDGGAAIGGLDDMDAGHRGWDQFALNEARFGVKTDYKEELYTTELDYSKSRISAAEANRIAREIETKGAGERTTNIHMLEERGMEVDADEEALYGAVIGTGAVKSARSTGAPGAPTQTQKVPVTSSIVAPGAKWADKVKAGVTPPAASTSAAGSQVRSHAIAIDARRETNKLRAQMSGSRTSSPYGTPNFNQSPLVGDAKLLEALNLDPGAGSSKITDETRDQFEAFKRHQEREKAKSAAGEGEKSSAATSTSSEKKSLGLNPNAKSFSFNVGAREFSPAPKGPPQGQQPPPPPPPGEMPPQFYNGPGQYAPQYAVPIHGGPYGYPGRGGMGPMMYAPAGHLYAPVMYAPGGVGGPGRGYGGPPGGDHGHHRRNLGAANSAKSPR